MTKKQREEAKASFSQYGQDFHATLVQEDDNFFIMDWHDRNGSGNMATRYILDKKNGTLIITGDSGSCIATWHNKTSPEEMARYIDSVDYFIEKIQCTEFKYSFEWKNVVDDLNELRKEYMSYVQEGDFYDNNRKLITPEDCEEDFDEMQSILYDIDIRENMVYPEELTDIFEKYTTEWYEGGFANLGKRVHIRIYQWIYGFQTGVKEIRDTNVVSEYRDKIYREVWKEYVTTDILSIAKDTGLCSKDTDLTESIPENLKRKAEEIADMYVYNGDYDCNLSYWDNLENLIREYRGEVMQHLRFKVGFNIPIPADIPTTPGGFTIITGDGKEVQFDFEYSSTEVEGSERIFEMWGLDIQSFPESEFINPETLRTIQGFDDIFVDLEGAGEEAAVSEILEMSIGFENGQTFHISKEILDKYNEKLQKGGE